MKKLLLIFAAFAMFSACVELDINEPVDNGNCDMNIDNIVGTCIPEVIYASVAGDDTQGDSKTRTYFDADKQTIHWHKGDEVSLFVNYYSNLKLVNTSDDGVSPAEFKPESYDPDDLYNNYYNENNFQVKSPKYVYPYNAETVCIDNNGVETLVVSYPSEQAYARNSFGSGANLMVAASEDSNSIDHIYFRNACGYLIIKLKGKGEMVKSIKLRAHNGVKIAGKAHVVASHDAAPDVSMTEEATSEVLLNCGDGVILGDEVTEFWFALPPVTFNEGLTIEITDDHDNVVTKSTAKEVKINRNEIKPMAALTMPEKLYYTRSDDSETPLKFYDNMANPFDAEIIAHYYDKEEGRFVIAFNTPVTKINDNAFRDTKIATVSIPGTVTTIGQNAFRNSYLTEITIPGTVNVISREAFDSCLELKNVSFLPSPTNSPLYLSSHGATKYTPFYNCAYVESINLDRNIFEGDVVGVEGVIHSTCTFTYGRVTNVILGQQVERICDEMFWEAKITSIVIPSSVKSIGKKAFYSCSSLESVTIEGTIPSIDATIFNGCSNLRTLNITGSVETIGESAFDGFNLTSLNISGHVGTIGKGAFDDNDKMTSFNVTGTVNTIGESAFNDCDALSTINITSTVGTVGAKAFSDCDAVTTLAIRANTVEDYAYKDMDGLKTATLYGATVGTGVFKDSDALETIIIDGGVNSIGNDAFYSCPSIKNVTFLPSPTNTDLVLGYQTYLGGEEGPFYDSKLESVDWNRNIKYTLYENGDLDQYDEGLFSQNSNLKNVTIGKQVKTILPYTFAESSGMTSIEIPESVETIGDYAFAKCTNLETITYKGTPTLGSNVFKDCKETLSQIYQTSKGK